MAMGSGLGRGNVLAVWAGRCDGRVGQANGMHWQHMAGQFCHSRGRQHCSCCQSYGEGDEKGLQVGRNCRPDLAWCCRAAHSAPRAALEVDSWIPSTRSSERERAATLYGQPGGRKCERVLASDCVWQYAVHRPMLLHMASCCYPVAGSSRLAIMAAQAGSGPRQPLGARQPPCVLAASSEQQRCKQSRSWAPQQGLQPAAMDQAPASEWEQLGPSPPGERAGSWPAAAVQQGCISAGPACQLQLHRAGCAAPAQDCWLEEASGLADSSRCTSAAKCWLASGQLAATSAAARGSSRASESSSNSKWQRQQQRLQGCRRQLGRAIVQQQTAGVRWARHLRRGRRYANGRSASGAEGKAAKGQGVLAASSSTRTAGLGQCESSWGPAR